MSRGFGKWQRLILSAMSDGRGVDLHGATRAQTSALVRAARKLEAAGLCLLLRFWNDDHTAVGSCAFPPTRTDLKKLSVERVPQGTHATFTGSIRDIAASQDISPTQAWRIIRRLRAAPSAPDE